MIARQAVVFAMIAMSARAIAAQDTTFARADRETSAALTRIVQAASARGLPIDHIVSKVQFALVVHAPAARIVETAQAVADRLGVARDAIAPDSLSGDIAAGEDALSFKIPKGILTRIREASPGRAIAVPIGVLTQLVANRVPPDRAGDIVTRLIRLRASPEQLVALGNDVNSDVQRGARAMESLDTRYRGLNAFLAPNAGQALVRQRAVGRQPAETIGQTGTGGGWELEAPMTAILEDASSSDRPPGDIRSPGASRWGPRAVAGERRRRRSPSSTNWYSRIRRPNGRRDRDGLSTRAWFHAAGLSSLQPNNAWTGQAIALGGFSGEIAHPARWEVGGALSGFSETGAPTTTSGELNARVRFAAAMGGIALGGGTGLTTRAGDDVTLGRGTVEGWWSIGNERLLAGATRTRAGPASYTDLGIGWRHEAKGASLEASTGIRSATGNAGWQSAGAELWMAPRIALALGAGNALPDAVRGNPEHTLSLGGTSHRVAAARHALAESHSERRSPRHRVSSVGGNGAHRGHCPKRSARRSDGGLHQLGAGWARASRRYVVRRTEPCRRVSTVWRFASTAARGLRRRTCRVTRRPRRGSRTDLGPVARRSSIGLHHIDGLTPVAPGLA